jgi:hypothetical protein
MLVTATVAALAWAPRHMKEQFYLCHVAKGDQGW